MRKALACMALLASAVMAETVYATPNGKTFHKAQTCKILARSAKVMAGDRAKAEAAGLHGCRSCYGQHKTGGNSAWAAPVQGK